MFQLTCLINLVCYLSQSGKIADELEYVNHHVRTKLDEIKRSELERLRHLATKEYELRHGLDTEHLKMPPEHVDLSNPHTFEIEDLRKLILKVTFYTICLVIEFPFREKISQSQDLLEQITILFSKYFSSSCKVSFREFL